MKKHQGVLCMQVLVNKKTKKSQRRTTNLYVTSGGRDSKASANSIVKYCDCSINNARRHLIGLVVKRMVVHMWSVCGPPNLNLDAAWIWTEPESVRRKCDLISQNPPINCYASHYSASETVRFNEFSHCSCNFSAHSFLAAARSWCWVPALHHVAKSGYKCRICRTIRKRIKGWKAGHFTPSCPPNT